MKWHSILLLPCSALAFQNAAPTVHRVVGQEEQLSRAEQCATLLDFCDVDELDTLADELEEYQSTATRRLQGRVFDILQKQSELKRLMDDYATDIENGPDTFGNYMHYHW